MPLKQAARRLAVKTPLGDDVLVLAAFDGHEEISRLFGYQLELISDNNAVSAAEIVGKNVTFSVAMADDSPRYFNGFVSRLVAGDEDLKGRRNYRAEVVPWLWFLTRTSDCRIFQNKSAPDIIQRIFTDLGFSDFKLQLSGKHPQRDYCVQYRETDFNFVSRLMEEEGIFYFFKHEQGKHTLVLADAKGGYFDCPESQVDYPRDPGSRAIEDHITCWEHRYEFRTGKWAQTDYNFIDHPARGAPDPAKLMMTNETTTVNLPDEKKYEFYDYPGGYEKKEDGDGYTKARMEEEEVQYDVVQAASNCRSFTLGGKFKIRHHTSKSEEGKGFVITSIRHAAREFYETGEGEGFDYHNSFTCIPDSVVFRPARATPRPRIHGVQPAVVTGPPGEEIYPDKYGRVKVQFFWDREGKRDDKSSCWIRVSQDYAGKSWGGVCIPRIGQEVLVAFLEGDPDRPIITGRVYNAEQTIPYPLPEMKTVSGLKTNSSPGGEGYNEIRLEDAKGKEMIYLHAQRELDVRVLGDSLARTYGDRHQIIGWKSDGDDNAQQQSAGDQREMVYGEKHLSVGKNQEEHVGGDMKLHIGGGDEGGGNLDVVIEGTMKESVGKDCHYHILGQRAEKVEADQSLSVGGSQQEKVGIKHALEAGTEIHLKAGTKFVIEAGVQLTLIGSGGFIDIGPTGINIQGSLVNINSGGAAGAGSGSSPTAPQDPQKANPKQPDLAFLDQQKSGKKSTPF